MKHLRIIIFGIIILFLSACSSTVSVKNELIRGVDTHALEPSGAFLIKDALHIEYMYEHRPIYFIARLDDSFTEGNEQIALLSVARERDKLLFEPPKAVPILENTVEDVLRAVIIPLTPKQTGKGILLFIQHYEMVLVRQPDGTPDLLPLKEADGDLEIIGRIEDDAVTALLKEELKKQLARQGKKGTRFLLRLNSVPQTPFVYMDIQSGQTVQLQLPDYYKVKQEMSSLGYSGAFVYSFVIKSNLWGTIKAPFTSAHRLFAYATSTLYTMFPPHIWDLKKIPPLSENKEGFSLDDFNRWLDKHITKQCYPARLELLIDGKEFFPHFMLAIQRAVESVFVRVYIFKADPYGMSLADVMKKRASEGIDVRVVLDELNVVMTSDNRPELKTQEDFVQPRTIKKYLKKHSSVDVRTHPNLWGTFDHGKVYIVDRRLAYTGGMNIGQEYRYTWHDMMVAMEGPIVGKLVKDYYENWSFVGIGGDYAAGYRKLFSKKKRSFNEETPDMVPVRLLYTKPNESEIFAAEREAMRRAQKRIYMENAYFSDDRIIKELIEARGRGVDVRVIFPAKNNISVMAKNNRYIANKLLKNGIRVYFYNGMTHIKAGLFDDYAVVGSANVDKMSLYINREMSLGIDDPAFIGELETRLFESDFASSEELTEPLQIGWTYAVVSSLANQL